MNDSKKTENNPYQRIAENGYLLLLGGMLYCWIEILFRGWTHWSMAVCGGICAVAIYRINERLPHWGTARRALLGTLVITLAEFTTGCIVNLWLRLDVWDYSSLPFHLWGQICPRFTVIWFLLCIPAGFLCGTVRRRVFLYEF